MRFPAAKSTSIFTLDAFAKLPGNMVAPAVKTPANGPAGPVSYNGPDGPGFYVDGHLFNPRGFGPYQAAYAAAYPQFQHGNQEFGLTARTPASTPVGIVSSIGPMRSMHCFAADGGTSLLDSLPQLVTGSTSLITATNGLASELPLGSVQLTGGASPIQTRPPINWLPILLVGGALITLAIWMNKNKR